MNSQIKSEDSWNTVSKKRKSKNKNENDIILFFRKIKEELDNEFSFMNKEKNEKISEKKNAGKTTPKNIFSLLIDDSE